MRSGNEADSPPFSNPQFISVSNPPDLNLQADSPAIGVGDASLGVSTFGAVDFNGNPRIAGDGKINLGAYEQSTKARGAAEQGAEKPLFVSKLLSR